MTDRHWYPRYTGDYARDTAHLTLIEHGAYVLLLDHYYSTKQSLPANASILHRVCRCTTTEEGAAVDFVLKNFFNEINGRFHNSRADSELFKKEKISKIRSLAANAKHMHSKCNANATTTTSTIGKKESKGHTGKKVSIGLSRGKT